jgi:hypothetical protein
VNKLLNRNLIYKTFRFRIVLSAPAEKPRDEDRDNVKAHHRRSEQHHIRNVGGRRNNSGDDQNDDNRNLPTIYQKRMVD